MFFNAHNYQPHTDEDGVVVAYEEAHRGATVQMRGVRRVVRREEVHGGPHEEAHGRKAFPVPPVRQELHFQV